jgi:hypothetical protein
LHILIDSNADNGIYVTDFARRASNIDGAMGADRRHGRLRAHKDIVPDPALVENHGREAEEVRVTDACFAAYRRICGEEIVITNHGVMTDRCVRPDNIIIS